MYLNFLLSNANYGIKLGKTLLSFLIEVTDLRNVTDITDSGLLLTKQTGRSII